MRTRCYTRGTGAALARTLLARRLRLHLLQRIRRSDSSQVQPLEHELNDVRGGGGRE